MIIDVSERMKGKLEARDVHMTRISKFPDAKSGEKKLVGRCINYIFAAGRAFSRIPITLTIFVKLERGTQVRTNEIKITCASCKLDKHVGCINVYFERE